MTFPLRKSCLAVLLLASSILAGAAELPRLPVGYGEEVVLMPSTGKQPPVLLEMTIFKPPGAGPFPVLVFNHGKDSTTDAHRQDRFRPWEIVREFVMRGYLVAAPNRRGFGNSGGAYQLRDCDVTADGLRQREDVAAAIDYLQHRPDADMRRVLLGGGSQGGWVSMAYGQVAPAGVLGILNFNGGSRQIKCPGWEDNLVRAFGAYGRNARVPSLWVYGDNDVFWSRDLIRRMLEAYRRSGGAAELADIGNFKDDAHKLIGDPDGFGLWWPPVEKFLTRLELPVEVIYRPAEAILPPSGYAAVDNVAAVPRLDAKARDAYREFLRHGYPRVFVLSPHGKWSYSIGGEDPLDKAMQSCQKARIPDCRPYAINGDVVWRETASDKTGPALPPASGYAALDDLSAVPYLNDRGREKYREFLTHASPKAFVVVPDGSVAIAYGGRDPMGAALQSCRTRHSPCEAYAVDDRVVWERKKTGTD